jgi:hypothetical protein
MSIVNIVGGALFLTLGRKIFWLFVAAIGFFAGLELATRYLNISPQWVAWLVALAVGVVGALLAYFFQKLVIGVAGFLVGAFISSRLISYLGSQAKSVDWLIILFGGILGLVLMYAVFEWALIILSSLAGTILVVEGLKLAAFLSAIVGLVLFVAGVIFQAGLNRQRPVSRKQASNT